MRNGSTTRSTRQLGRGIGVALMLGAALTCCTTFVRPIACGPTPRACGEMHDARFCENIVVAAKGADCASAGLSAGQRFCYVTMRGPCVWTTYALVGRDCVVSEYTPVREWYDCSPGTPTFGN